MSARTELSRRVDDGIDLWDQGDGTYFETEAEPYLALDTLLRPSIDSDVATLDDEEPDMPPRSGGTEDRDAET
jgi:hypothetical protein